MAKRPLSLTVIGTFLIVMSLFTLASAFFIWNSAATLQVFAASPLPLWVHQLFSVASAVVALICGYGILEGRNWSRFVYVAVSLAGLLLNLATIPSPGLLLFGASVLLIFSYFLFRPAANDWFRRGGARQAG